MLKVVGVRFRKAGKIYYFDPGEQELEVGDYVVAETELGPELGWVAIAPYQVVTSEVEEPLKPIMRAAAAADLEQKERLEARAREALALAREKVAQRRLPMTVANAEYNLDGSLLRVFFTTQEHVNYRDVVWELSRSLGTKVRFFQVGPRDEAKLMGTRVSHYGICGRCLCCASWLGEFPNVSVKMAKFQSLPMDPFKLSGACGRLLCCLTYEYPIYQELRGQLPRVGEVVTTPAGRAKVVAVNVLEERAVLWFEEGQSSQEMTVQQMGYGTLVRPAELEGEEEAILVGAATGTVGGAGGRCRPC
ncbi:MAG: stage 0 sporulation family protein [Dehalococcoidia bacterium]